MDPVKRNGYDSTVLTFDDSIPPSRATLLSQSAVSLDGTSSTTTTTTTTHQPYTDDDFYDVFGPVFTRNLRFDAKLRPELNPNGGNSNTGGSGSSSRKSSGSSSSSNTNTTTTTFPTPPSLGDASTPLPHVHAFYDYWIHFTSWRDFSTQATIELELSDTIENSESRYEKRYYQTQIDKRTKHLKRLELIRLQTLVERAMEADPRLYVY